MRRVGALLAVLSFLSGCDSLNIEPTKKDASSAQSQHPANSGAAKESEEKSVDTTQVSAVQQENIKSSHGALQIVVSLFASGEITSWAQLDTLKPKQWHQTAPQKESDVRDPDAAYSRSAQVVEGSDEAGLTFNGRKDEIVSATLSVSPAGGDYAAVASRWFGLSALKSVSIECGGDLQREPSGEVSFFSADVSGKPIYLAGEAQESETGPGATLLTLYRSRDKLKAMACRRS